MKHNYNRPATELDYRERINQAMRYIQDHLGDSLSIPDIAASANFSTFHFHRIFTAFVGETVGDYLKRIRMTRAAALVVAGHPIKQIAPEVGYKTSSAFIQIFKNTFGLVPSAVRKGEIPALTHFPKTITPQEFSHTESAACISPIAELAGLIRNQPTLKIFYIRTHGKVNESFSAVAGKAFDELHDYLKKQNLWGQTVARLGILRDIDLISPTHSRFDACIAFPAGLVHTTQKRIETGVLEAGKCAVFLHKGPYDTLWQTWNWIYRYWLPGSGLPLRDADPFEVYLNDKRHTDASELLTEINIPLS